MIRRSCLLLLSLALLLSACGGATVGDRSPETPNEQRTVATTPPVRSPETPNEQNAPRADETTEERAPPAPEPTEAMADEAASEAEAPSLDETLGQDAQSGQAIAEAEQPDTVLPPESREDTTERDDVVEPAEPRPPEDPTFFDDYGVNPFVDPREDRLSTFAIDVDTASYTVMRNFITSGSLPPPESVRTEEYINFFRHDYQGPTEGAFAITTDIAPAPFVFGDHQIMRVGIQGRTIDPVDRKPAALTFVIDVSGSMDEETKLPLLKRSLTVLVEQLQPTDSIAVVAYSDEAFEVLPPTSVRDRDTILRAIGSLEIGGSTNVEEGLLLGYDLAERAFIPDGINRVILSSDGVANVGNTGPEAILESIGDFARQGIYLTTVGFGMGDYNDVLMEQLANQGDGTYAYVDTLDEARRVFAAELTGTLAVIARDAKIQVTFDPNAVLRYRLLGYENRDVADEDFRDDTVDAGEVGSGHSITALYEVALVSDLPLDTDLATVAIRYQDPDSDTIHEINQGVSSSDLLPSFERAPIRFQQDLAVAAYAEVLRGGYWGRNATLNEIARLADRVSGELPEDQELREFARLVWLASNLE